MSRRRNKSKKKQDETLIDVYEVGGQAQDFFERNQNLILIGLFGTVLLIGGIFAYNRFFKAPRLSEAISQISKAQDRFDQDSFALALSNPGDGYPGFLDVIDSYSGTPTANLAKYYAGVSYLHLGDYQKAVDYMNDFSPVGDLTPIMKFGTLGDAYAELQDLDNSKKQYKKAIGSGNNDVLEAYYVKKLAMLYDKEGNVAESLALFKKLRDEYAQTGFARDVEKYITRLESN